MDIQVRRERATDIDRTYAIVESAFRSRLEADLVNALRRSAEPQLSLVADVHDVLVGHVFFSPVTIDAAGPAPLACQLSPGAVRPKFQRRGVGSALIRTGLSECRAVGWSAVFVVGDPAYYSRFGFRLAAPLGFSYPGPHDPYLQVIELDDSVLAGLSGRILLHPAFADVGVD